MSSNVKKILIGALLACMPLAMMACGNDSDDVAPTPAPTTTKVSGKAIKGIVSGGIVEVFKINSKGEAEGLALGSNTTNDKGEYTVTIPATSGPVIVKVKGSATATYLDEVTNKPVLFKETDSFRAVVPKVEEAGQVAITPVTEVAARQVAGIANASATALTQGILTATIAQANTGVAARFGVTDILAPPKALGDATATEAEIKYATVLTLVSQIVNDKAASSGSTTALMTAIETVLVKAVSTDSATRQEFATAITAAVASVTANTTTTAVLPPAVVTAVTAAVTAAVTTVPETKPEPEPTTTTAATTTTTAAGATTTAAGVTTTAAGVTTTAAGATTTAGGVTTTTSGSTATTTVTTPTTTAGPNLNVSFSGAIIP